MKTDKRMFFDLAMPREDVPNYLRMVATKIEVGLTHGLNRQDDGTVYAEWGLMDNNNELLPKNMDWDLLAELESWEDME